MKIKPIKKQVDKVVKTYVTCKQCNKTKKENKYFLCYNCLMESKKENKCFETEFKTIKCANCEKPMENNDYYYCLFCNYKASDYTFKYNTVKNNTYQVCLKCGESKKDDRNKFHAKCYYNEPLEQQIKYYTMKLKNLNGIWGCYLKEGDEDITKEYKNFNEKLKKISNKHETTIESQQIKDERKQVFKNEIEEYKITMKEWEKKYYPTANEDPDYFIHKSEQLLKLKKLEMRYLFHFD